MTLKELCQQKIDEYINKRGEAIWEHRSKYRKSVSGSVRYKVLKRAKGRCELCGISKEIKALEVDHIVPKNWQGEDSINNYQALCYTCNANKRDTDDEDFRVLENKYKHRDKDCTFCNCDSSRIISENNLAYGIHDKYPVTQSHSLIIPKRHSNDYFDLYQPEINAINSLISDVRETILTQDKSVQAFNIGMNNGSVAGQTIMHTHIHLIPRRVGDVIDPIGGIRNVIPGKGNYI
jgi:diadenosine tetraphosphate (Ap4A) HIT family hydrolase